MEERKLQENRLSLNKINVSADQRKIVLIHRAGGTEWEADIKKNSNSPSSWGRGNERKIQYVIKIRKGWW